jgi:ankyrin repeat protein
MKKLFLFWCVISLICPLTDAGLKKAEGCTIGVASGKATADGRPLLWKNRDGEGRDCEVAYCKDGRFKHLVMAPGGDTQWIGGGVNEVGFCIVYSASFNLPENSKIGVDGGGMMKWALKQCVTVDDFEDLLKQTNVSGRRTACNIGVIDAFGGAAIFETGNYSYTRFDATDPKVAPQGYIVRTTFAFTGDENLRRTKLKYEHTNELWQQAVKENQLDCRYVLRKVCRDFSGTQENFHISPQTEVTEENTINVLRHQDSISGHSTTYTALFHGVKPDENPSLTTFWAILGNPILSVAVPSWVIAESTAPELDGKEFSPICRAARDLYLANYVTGDDKRRPFLNLEMLPDIWDITYPTEDRIFDQTDNIMSKWRQEYPTAQQVVSFHRSLASEVMDALEETTEMLMHKDGPTANLRLALHMRSIKKAKAFIEGGANINVSDGHGYTPTHYSVEYNLKEIVQLLISKKADINTKNNIGQTPLDIAIGQNSKDILRQLVANGGKASSIFGAAHIGDLASVKTFLEEGVDVNVRGQRRQTALHIAAREGHKEVVEFLLDRGADVNAGMNLNRTAAELAMDNDHNDIAELLISKGADISPLHLAISMKDEAKARSLIEGGADVNKQTPKGTTPLNRAVGKGLKDIAELLIEHDADVNAGHFWGWTPLHSAAEEGYKDLVELLITKGANINARDGDGVTPLWYAEKNNRTEIVDLLRKHGAKE